MRLALVPLLIAAACGGDAPPVRSEDEAARSAQIAGRSESAEHARREPAAFAVEVRGDGRPVILIPGLACPGAVWSGTVEHLRDHQTHTLTLAGFAGQPRIDAPLMRTTVEELARYIRDHRLRSPVIIGHSLGGFIAYWLAAHAPDLVGPVIIVDAGAAGGVDDRAAAEQARSAWRDVSDDEFARKVRAIFSQMSARPERMAPLIPVIARSDRTAVGDAVYELSLTTMRDRLDRIRAPVLVVLADGGFQDRFRRQADAVRDHQVEVIPETGHFVMLDDPQRFYAAIDRFLAAHPAGSDRSLTAER